MAFSEQDHQGAVFTHKEDIALQIDETIRRNAELRRQRLLRKVTISGAAVVLLAGVVGSYFLLANRGKHISTPHSNELLFGEVSESVFNYGTLRETQVSLPNGRTYAIQIYDFDVYYYTQGEGRVTNEPEFLSVLIKHQKDFTDSWVVIFAGASFEGTTKKNLDLCRCRVWNVASLMSRQGKINGLGYWSIAAGEFRLRSLSADDFGEDGPEVEAEEEAQAKQIGEEGLRAQRRLLVVSVKPLRQESGDAAQPQLNEVADALAGKGLLPTNYDKGKAKPASLDPTDEHNNPCPTDIKSVRARRESDEQQPK